MLRLLTLSTLFPDATRPNFGIFVERQTLGLATRPDVSLRVIAPRGLPPPPLDRLARYRPIAEAPRQQQWKGVDVHRPAFLNVPGIGGRLHGAMLARAAAPVIASLRRDFPFDLIAAEFFFPDGVAAIALGRRFGVPVSIKARGTDIAHWASNSAVAGQLNSAAQAADGLLAVSQALRRDMIALGMPGEKIEVSYTGVDLDRFIPGRRAAAKAELGVEGPLIVSLGSLTPVKRHDVVIDAMTLLPNVSLWIVGEGPERTRLAARIAERSLGDRVRLAGPIPHTAIPNVLAAADAMALASASEGLANAWLEALASGTPIVIPDVGGAREVLDRKAAGAIVDRTPEAFAAALSERLAQPPEPHDVRAAAERFTWPANAAQLMDYYSRLVADHHRPGAPSR
ncbi:glycosyltransferase [Sphingosinithalassobacter sp. LHW66-3]|uniref:glycosyltransferase n=1 Tax=Sphingosinithalassobacter sp. LHW66-3 TaxID=3424718 RepID=UPI003D6C6AEB